MKSAIIFFIMSIAVLMSLYTRIDIYGHKQIQRPLNISLATISSLLGASLVCIGSRYKNR